MRVSCAWLSPTESKMLIRFSILYTNSENASESTYKHMRVCFGFSVRTLNTYEIYIPPKANTFKFVFHWTHASVSWKGWGNSQPGGKDLKLAKGYKSTLTGQREGSGREAAELFLQHDTLTPSHDCTCSVSLCCVIFLIFVCWNHTRIFIFYSAMT